MDNRIQKVNLLKCFSGPSDNRSFCAYNLESAKTLITWYCIGKSINGRYPLWANMYDLWLPNIKKELAPYWYNLCFAYILADNRCIVTKFEKDNPVKGASEIFVENPLCPTNKTSFWCNVLAPLINNNALNDPGRLLVESVTDLYKYWNNEYCKGQILEHVGLKDEAYFKYFTYPDFITPSSGLIQIRKYAEQNMKANLLERLSTIQKLTKVVKEEIFGLLTERFRYFE